MTGNTGNNTQLIISNNQVITRRNILPEIVMSYMAEIKELFCEEVIVPDKYSHDLMGVVMDKYKTSVESHKSLSIENLYVITMSLNKIKTHSQFDTKVNNKLIMIKEFEINKFLNFYFRKTNNVTTQSSNINIGPSNVT